MLSARLTHYVTPLRHCASYEEGERTVDSRKVVASTNHDPFLFEITLGMVGMRADATATSHATWLTSWDIAPLYFNCPVCNCAVLQRFEQTLVSA